MPKDPSSRSLLSPNSRGTFCRPYPDNGRGVSQGSSSKEKEGEECSREDWEEATCAICMEYPHNAVLLQCSSHDKGCRPYMCDTGYRHSNCLDQYKEAKTVSIPSDTHALTSRAIIDGVPVSMRDLEMSYATPERSPLSLSFEDLSCPLCRGTVSGWKVVEPARHQLNRKPRVCAREACSFTGTYKELCEHAVAVHLSLRPSDIVMPQPLSFSEFLINTYDIGPGGTVLEDYVHEERYVDAGDDSDFPGDDENWMTVFMLRQLRAMQRPRPDY